MAASFEQFFFIGHGEDVPLRFQSAKSPWRLCHVEMLLATPSGERCQFNGITGVQSSCERFCLKFVSGALVILLCTVVSQIQIGIDIQEKKGLNQALRDRASRASQAKCLHLEGQLSYSVGPPKGVCGV